MTSRPRIADVCAHFGNVSERTVRRWQRTRGFPAHKYLHGRRVWDQGEVLAWEAQHLAAVPPAPPSQLAAGTAAAARSRAAGGVQ